jgi:hypothetical protein
MAAARWAAQITRVIPVIKFFGVRYPSSPCSNDKKYRGNPHGAQGIAPHQGWQSNISL